MFFQPRPRHDLSQGFHQPFSSHHSHAAAGPSTRRRLRELDAREEDLMGLRDRVASWARGLEAEETALRTRAREVEQREAEIAMMERQLQEKTAALRQRVATLDAHDQESAAESLVALRSAAATVIQRAVRRFLANRMARTLRGGLRKVRELGEEFNEALGQFRAQGNLALLEDTLTKLLEAADGISTQRAPPMLRAERRRFVRRVMAVLDDPHGDDAAEEAVVNSDMSSTTSASCSDTDGPSESLN